jgi:ABC-type antimicrobial peptide transport system permease subunit
MILKNLLRRKARTLLTMLGISMGVATIIALGALADGLEAGYTSLLTGSKADLVLSQPNAIEVSYSTVDEQIGAELRAMPEVKRVSGMLEGFVQIEGAPYFFIFGYPGDSFILERFQIKDGIPLSDWEARRQQGQPMLLGSAAAETLKKKAGDSIRMMGSVYRVIGIYETGDAFEDSGAILDLPDAQELLDKPRKVSLFYIQLKDKHLSERLQKRVERRWPDLSLSGAAKLADDQIMGDTMKGYMYVIAGLAILLGGVGMMNAQLMAVFERTREIGVLRAVGWSQARILTMILGETLLVSLAGGGLGIGLGFLALNALASSTVMMGATTASITPGLISQALITVLVLGLVGGLFPAWRAARLQPIEALRYEGGSSGERVHRLPVGGMALQSLWQRSTRTLLTLCVIALTVGAIMALEAIVRSAFDDLAVVASGSGTHVVLRQAEIADTSTSAIDQSIGQRIAALTAVEGVSGMMMTAVMMPDSGAFFVIQGYSPAEFAINHFKIVEGQPLTNNHQIIIGRSMSEALKKGVGDALDLQGFRFRIVGIYESGVSWEELGGVVTLRDAQVFMGRPRKVTLFMVKMKDPRQAEALVEQINRQYPQIQASLSGDFVSQMPDMQASNAMLGGISLLAIVVGGLGVMNTMLMSVLERTREIGVLRALGWRQRAVMGLILRESVLLGLIGGIAGVLVALGLGILMTMIPIYGEMLEPAWQADLFVRALTVAFLLGILGGLYPAFRATRLQPVEALRYE